MEQGSDSTTKPFEQTEKQRTRMRGCRTHTHSHTHARTRAHKGPTSFRNTQAVLVVKIQHKPTQILWRTTASPAWQENHDRAEQDVGVERPASSRQENITARCFARRNTQRHKTFRCRLKIAPHEHIDFRLSKRQGGRGRGVKKCRQSAQCHADASEAHRETTLHDVKTFSRVPFRVVSTKKHRQKRKHVVNAPRGTCWERVETLDVADVDVT